MKLAFDFGTTNSVVARWDEARAGAEILSLPDLSLPPETALPPIIPSLFYLQDGQTGQAISGHAVRAAGLDRLADNRLFRNFKRGLVTQTKIAPRQIDGQEWTVRAVGDRFLQTVLQALPHQPAEIEQLVLTAPVESFEMYVAWLNEVMAGYDFGSEQVRVVDESTAAALGYAVTEPDALVLVFDFGGGTLDISLVQLPENRAKTGGFLKRLRRRMLNQHTARVIAKAGQITGGSDIDHWLQNYILSQLDHNLENPSAALLTACEQAKINLSAAEQTEIAFSLAGQDHSLPLTRVELETLLEENGFFTVIRRTIDKVMFQARRQGIFREDIDYVLLVGGTTLMPAVQQVLKTYFSEIAVRADKPFTAVAEGALQVAAGFGLEDYLVHSYGLRHLDPESQQQRYEEIIPMGTRYPTEQPIEILLGAAHPDQEAIEFVIGEINTEAAGLIEVQYENGEAVFVAQGDDTAQQVVPLNEEAVSQALAQLLPPGQPGQDRIKAQFSIDDERRLRLTLLDLQTETTLLQDVVLTALK